jgi:hypothetical protein
VQYLSPLVPNPYAGFDLFAVVRNPYERAVSQYYYHCQFRRRWCFGARGKLDTAARMNRKLGGILRQVAHASKNESDYFLHWPLDLAVRLFLQHDQQ